MAMFPGVPAILDGKPRTAMQAAQTHGTLLFHPKRLSIPHFDCLHRALLGAQAAADAGALYMKMSCAPHFIVINRLSDPIRDKCRSAR